jgi:hypothetical protein
MCAESGPFKNNFTVAVNRSERAEPGSGDPMLFLDPVPITAFDYQTATSNSLKLSESYFRLI